MKDIFMQAALKLAESRGKASDFAAADVVAAAGASEADFRSTFADLGTFQRELASALFSQARESVIATTAGMHSGLKQLSAAFVAYLDYNLSRPALQELAHHIQYTPEGLDLLTRMETGVALVAQADLAAMRATHCPERSRLLTTIAVSVVRAEYKARKKLPELREAMLDLCRLSAG